jgi:phytoene synthase
VIVAVQPATGTFSPSPSQLALAYSVCRGIARTAAKNFYYGFMVLPGPKRRALCAVYAYMRRCDDISDDPLVRAEQRRERLSEWLESTHKAFAGQPTDDPILLALSDTRRNFGIPTELFDELAYGTAMDLQFPNAPGSAEPVVYYRTFEDLRLYCYRVASVVGLVCIRIFGYRDSAAERLAEDLGIAFQLTNMIRDVREDALSGRIYLPAEELKQFEISPSELGSNTAPIRLRWLLAAEADRARVFYAASDKLMQLISEDSQPALWVLVTIYRGLLERIAAREYDVYGPKISLSKREKFLILGKGFLKRIV